MVNITIAKMIANIIVTSSTGMVVGSIIRTNVPAITSAQVAMRWVGAWAIGGLVAEQCWKGTERQIDNGVAMYNKMKTDLIVEK